jgi:radical SAM superfamily enzyme YgiQ (UPF0313 family)
MSNHALIFSSRAYPHQRSSGAHRIATFLRSHGWDVEVIDFAAHWPLDSLKELTRSRTGSKTVFFGFSTFFNYWNDNLDQFTSWLKETYPNIKTVIGGQQVSFTSCKNMDYWIDSFGENAILALVQNLIGNSNDKIRFDVATFGSKKLIKAIESYPSYPLESYANILEKRDFLEPYEWLTVEFSRGCRFSCDFCNFPVLGVKGDYSRSQEDFEREMKHNYDNFGIQNYYVADETFNDRVEKIIKFADIVENRLQFRPFFSGFMRADLMITKPESWEHLVRLNFGGHYYGIETFNHQIAKVVGKGMDPNKIKQGLVEIKNYFSSKMFYRGTISIIVGLPFETISSIFETEKWLIDNWRGQGLVIFPLDVEKPENSDMYTNTSKFSRNLIKYGLREIKSNNNKEQTSIFNRHASHVYDWRNGGYQKDDFEWEHDTMNVHQARAISEAIQEKSISVFSVDTWQLDVGCWNSQKPFQEIPRSFFELPKKQFSKVSKSITDRFLLNYIQSKLDWK